MNVRHTTLGSLDCQILQSSASPSHAAILCHGYGAPADDLVPLAAELAAPSYLFAFPAAPLSLAQMGMASGRAWWHLDMGRLLALQKGAGADLARLREEIPGGLSTARRQLLSAIEALRHAGFPPSRIVLGGFSQGAMLATDVALHLEEAPAGLALFSGTLINEADWGRRAPLRRGLRVMQSHGEADPILPFENAVALRQLLQSSGLEVDFLPFAGQHTIPRTALDRFGALLARVAG